MTTLFASAALEAPQLDFEHLAACPCPVVRTETVCVVFRARAIESDLLNTAVAGTATTLYKKGRDNKIELGGAGHTSSSH